MKYKSKYIYKIAKKTTAAASVSRQPRQRSCILAILFLAILRSYSSSSGSSKSFSVAAILTHRHSSFVAVSSSSTGRMAGRVPAVAEKAFQQQKHIRQQYVHPDLIQNRMIPVAVVVRFFRVPFHGCTSGIVNSHQSSVDSG